MYGTLPKRYFRGNTFSGLADNINVEIRDLLAQADVQDASMMSVAAAANDAMIGALVDDQHAREDATLVAAGIA